MTKTRVLIVATADRPAGVPEVVLRQVLGAGEVRVVAPALTTRLESWASDTDAAVAALILATHTLEGQNRRERRLREKARARFQLPVTELLIDGDGDVTSVHADAHA